MIIQMDTNERSASRTSEQDKDNEQVWLAHSMYETTFECHNEVIG